MPLIMKKQMNDYQDELVADYYRFRPPYHSEFIPRLAKEVNLKRTDVPLDLLCGRGEIAKHLSKYCDKVVAVDGSKQMLDRAEHAENIKFLLGDVNHVDFISLFKSQRFNHCFIGRAIHWIEENSLIEIRKSLFADPTWLVTMQGGYSKDNSWIQPYNEVLKSYSGLSNNLDWISKEKILNAGFNYHKSLNSVFSARINIDFLYGTALSYNMRAHVLKSFESEIKSSLRTVLHPYIQDDGFLVAKISNSALIYKS